MLNLVFAVLGLVVGGLLNVLADDLPARVRPALPHCPRCGHVYGPERWLAVARLVTGGRCPSCGLPTRRRAILVEAATAGIFALLPSFLTAPADLFLGAVYVAVLILVIVIDLEHRLILHVVTFPTTLFALAGSIFITGNSLPLALIGAVVGFLVFLGFFWLGQRLFGAGALGFGDVTLSMTLGAMLGFPLVLFALFLGILLGGALTVLLIVTRRISLRSYVAYGPYLAVAGIIMVIWGQRFLDWYLN